MVSLFLQKLFRISEIKESRILQITSICFFLVFIVSFSLLMDSSANSIVCSPHITHCDFYKSILIFDGFPYSYDRSIFYTMLLWVIFLWLYSLYIWEYTIVWWSLFILALYKALYIYAFSAGNYDYYDIVLVLIFLFAHNKLYWLRIAYVLLYFLAATIKIHHWWILGTYFSTMQLGMPIFPEILTPLFTNIIIFSQILLCWCLLVRKNTIIFIIAEIFFFSFHFYSGILVEYRYLLSTLPLMIVLFLIPQTIPYQRSYNIFSYIFLLLLFIGQSIAIIIPWDQKLTLEWNEYWLYMFEANHQCIATYELTWDEGTKNQSIISSRLARDRCDPYDAIMRYQNICKTAKNPISLKFDHSINGEPFYRIIDESDLCSLRYIPFTRNNWIKTEYDNPELIWFPVKNFFSGRPIVTTNSPTMSWSIIRLPGLEYTNPVSINSFQKILLPYLEYITLGYWMLWIMILVTMLMIHIRQIRYLNRTHQKTKEISLIQ